jgi:dihydrofolate reductase
MKAIVIVDSNWAIGCEGKLLVHIPRDLQFFKKMTLGKTVVMGRETLEAMPGGKPLKDRINFVITRNDSYEASCNICHSINETLKELSIYKDDEIFIIGGEEVYRQFIPLCDEIYVTKVDGLFKADKHFPNLDELSEWKMVWDGKMQEYEGTQYKFTRYARIKK